MELKVWVDGLQRVVCGVTQSTSCQEVIYALAHATGQTGRFVLVEQWRSSERSLAPCDRPLELLTKWGDYSNDVKFVLKQLESVPTCSSSSNVFPSFAKKPYLFPPSKSAALKTAQEIEVQARTESTPLPTIVAQEPRSRASQLSVMSQSAHETALLGSNLSHSDTHNISQTSIKSFDSSSSRGRPVVGQNLNFSAIRTSTPTLGTNAPPRSSSAKRPPLPSYDQVVQSRATPTFGTSPDRSYHWPASREELEKLIRVQQESMTHQQRTLEALEQNQNVWIEEDRRLARELDSTNKEINQLETQHQPLRQELTSLRSADVQGQFHQLNSNARISEQKIAELESAILNIDSQLNKCKAEENSILSILDKLKEQQIDNVEPRKNDPEIEKDIQQLENSIRLKKQKLEELFGKISLERAESDTSLSDAKKPPGVWV